MLHSVTSLARRGQTLAMTAIYHFGVHPTDEQQLFYLGQPLLFQFSWSLWSVLNVTTCALSALSAPHKTTAW
jgi:hypothetical protein